MTDYNFQIRIASLDREIADEITKKITDIIPVKDKRVFKPKDPGQWISFHDAEWCVYLNGKYEKEGE